MAAREAAAVAQMEFRGAELQMRREQAERDHEVHMQKLQAQEEECRREHALRRMQLELLMDQHKV